MYKQIGNKVAYYRKMRNLTQDELADRVNISVSSISKLERGKYNNNIPLSMLIMIAEGLRIDVSMLVTFDERENFLEFDQINRAD
jgi:transcriptional regulator with XRE-family HTH domain